MANGAAANVAQRWALSPDSSAALCLRVIARNSVQPTARCAEFMSSFSERDMELSTPEMSDGHHIDVVFDDSGGVGQFMDNETNQECGLGTANGYHL